MKLGLTARRFLPPVPVKEKKETSMFELHLYIMIDVCMNVVAFYLCIHLTP